MKRAISLLLLLALSFALIVPASAAVAEPVQPRYTHLGITSGSLTINENTGIAYCIARCTAVNGVTIEITGKLQQWKNGAWNTLKTWTESGTILVTLDKQWAVVSGYQYRFFITYTVRDSSGTVLEVDTQSHTYVYA